MLRGNEYMKGGADSSENEIETFSTVRKDGFRIYFVYI